jgi:hypothetical protein
LEKTRIATEYEAATLKFSEAVTQLYRNIGTSSKEEYDRLNQIADETRGKSEQARLALEKHITEHCC